MGRQPPVCAQLVPLALTCAVVACTDLSHQGTLTAAERAAVTAAVEQRLCNVGVPEICDLQVSMDSDGTVWLNGRTYTLAMADRAQQIARATPGVARVRSNILALPETQR